MREDLLHFVWKSQKFSKTNLHTTAGELVEVVVPGHSNTSSGPDFFNSRIRIAGQEWAGNLEIHLKSSDWYAHGHEKDANYDNVILHVVWEDDVAVFRKDGTVIPTLPLKNYTSETLIASYQHLMDHEKYKFINCEKDAIHVNDIVWKQWQERLFVERLEEKTVLIKKLLIKTKNDWESVLFVLLMKTFGLNKNGAAFFAIAEHLDSAVIRKVAKGTFQLESLLFGLGGFLNEREVSEKYYQDLKNEFDFLQQKFQIENYLGEKPIFYGLRPPNFPTIRLSQLANLYGRYTNLFQRLMDARVAKDFVELLDVKASSYWDTHYTFGRESKKRKKGLSKSFIRLIVINSIIPLKFCYDQFLGKNRVDELVQTMNEFPSEKNSVLERFENIGIPSESAFESQAKIQLYKTYCKKNRCLQCQIGASLLGRKN
jgi:hypothetical protein